MEKRTSYIIIGLLLVAAFLLGSIWTKIKIAEKQPGQITKEKEGLPEVTTITFPKKDVPEVKFFVMSFCPFGNQAESGLEPVYRLLKDKVKWLPRYVVYGKEYCDRAPDKNSCQKENCLAKDQNTWYCSMHGRGELNQDIREICSFNFGDLDKWWDFVKLVNKNCNSQDVETCWEKQAKEAGLNISKIRDCQKKESLSLLEKEVKEVAKYNALGSPMVFINDKLYEGGRAPEDYKRAICSGFTKSPSECNKVLGTVSSAVGGGCR